VKLVQQSINQSDGRKLNIVITGLPESTTMDSTDSTLFSELCVTNLKYNGLNQIVKTKHLGISMNSSKVRRLLITFDNSTTVTEIMSLARELRHSSDKFVSDNIFINYDLSREQERMAYESRVKRRGLPTGPPHADHTSVTHDPHHNSNVKPHQTSTVQSQPGRGCTVWRSTNTYPMHSFLSK